MFQPWDGKGVANGLRGTTTDWFERAGQRRMERCGWIRQVTVVADEGLIGCNEPVERLKHTLAEP